MKRKSIVLLIVLLAIGFATVSTTLIINGVVGVGTNKDSFIDGLVFDSKSLRTSNDSITAEISPSGRTLSFTTQTMTSVDETATVYFKLKNYSQYDATLNDPAFTCYFVDNHQVDTKVEAIADSPYMKLIEGHELDGDTILAGGNLSEESSVTVKQIKSSVDNNQEVKFQCEINATGEDSATPAIEKPVNYVEKPIFPNVLTDFPESSIGSSKVDNKNYGSFAYANTNLFKGKTLSKIGIPVKSVGAIDNKQTFTLNVIDKTDVDNFVSADIIRTYTLTLNEADLGTSTTVNKWVYVDLKPYNITLGENETLSFGSRSDSVNFGYYMYPLADLATNEYGFICRVDNAITLASPDARQQRLFFDIYYLEKKTDAEEQPSPTTLADALESKTLSILGDSISTFEGYSNNTLNNSTIGNNVVYYNSSTNKGIANVNDSWWKQVIDNNNMHLLVNNSWSGSTVLRTSNNNATASVAYNTDRPINLHDNTDDATFTNGTEPDIIATFIGINDFNRDSGSLGTFDGINFDTLITDNGDGTYQYGTATTIAEAYSIMMHKVVKRYNKSDIYVFTLLPNTWNTDYVTLEKFNSIIKSIANKYGVAIVDLYSNSGITKDNLSTYLKDGLHPNPAGMDLITETFTKVLEEKYLR